MLREGDTREMVKTSLHHSHLELATVVFAVQVLGSSLILIAPVRRV